jgi:hypothetical protein
MPDPTGRWVNQTQWQCPNCLWVNEDTDERCEKCDASVRPSEEEPVRPHDPLDVVGRDRQPKEVPSGALEAAAKAFQTVTRVTRAKAIALFGDSLRSGLTQHGEQGDLAWQAISAMPDGGQREALATAVDQLEEEGFALYRISDGGPG